MNTSAVLIGADVLEIMSTAMYSEPLVAYRELIQNSADAIDDAIRAGVLEAREGRVAMDFDRSSRTVYIKDNGLGLSNEKFEHTMLSFGASAKRDDAHRGFRGIGRLAGLGYCKNLVFRSRAPGDQWVSEVRWDSRKSRSLALAREVVSLEELALEAATIARTKAVGEPEHFFEVRLEGVRRLGDDRLFDALRINDYLSQVAPVPFHADFSFAEKIRAYLHNWSSLLEVDLRVDAKQVYKPYRDVIELYSGKEARIRDIEYLQLPAIDDRSAAYGWIAHHDYFGALKSNNLARGVRVRSGNLQIGEETLLRQAFKEERFNSWAAGEIHVFDPRLRPNARRDAFEPSAHVDNLYNQFRPYATEIARRCRAASKSRNVTRQLERMYDTLWAIDSGLKANRTALGDAVRRLIAADAHALLERLASEGVDGTVEFERVDAIASKLSVEGASHRFRMSERDAGRLELIRWLHDSGKDDVVIAVVPQLIGSAKHGATKSRASAT